MRRRLTNCWRRARFSSARVARVWKAERRVPRRTRCSPCKDPNAPCCGNPCCGDPCCGNPCCGQPCVGNPCGGDPCCGAPCCGDPCCGDPCCGDPCCGDCSGGSTDWSVQVHANFSSISDRAAYSLSCSSDRVKLESLGDDRYVATGCGRISSYRCACAGGNSFSRSAPTCRAESAVAKAQHGD